MPSSIQYREVQVLQDIDLGLFTLPTGLRCTLPERLATSYKDQLRVLGPGQSANLLTVPPPHVRIVSESMSAAEVAAAIETVGTQLEVNAPWGVGREVYLASGKILTEVIDLSQATSLTAAAQGASVLYFAGHAQVTGETGVLNVKDDRRSKRGIESRATIRNVVVDGAVDEALPGSTVHGYYAPAPASDGEIHSFYDTLFTQCKGDGLYIIGRHQLAGMRLKATANTGWGCRLVNVNDLKLVAPGFGGNLAGALYVEKCATPKFFGGDFWLPNSGFTGRFTVQLVDQARASFIGSEISGRLGIMGRNDQGSVRYDMSGNEFTDVNFKIDETLPASFVYTRPEDASTVTVSATIYIEDADGVIFNGCKLIYSDVVPTAPQLTATPDYAIQLESRTGNTGRIGTVFMRNASGMVHRRGRTGDGTYPPIVAWKKRFCNRPELIDWGFTPGALELKRYDATLLPLPREYVAAGATYNKVDFPLGYEWFTGGTQDDGTATFDIPAGPVAAPSGYVWAARVWP